MKAAIAGNAEAQYNVGELYYWGNGVSVDREQAMDWFLMAANNGNTDAMNWIGYMYKYGYGVTRNIRTAVGWYTKAANQGNPSTQYILGFVYQNDDEVKDLQQAVNWYQKAADNGNQDAKDKVKELNKQGYYAKEDVQEGILISCTYFMMIIIKNTKHSSGRKSKRQNDQ
jgi:TPR repeat protein